MTRVTKRWTTTELRRAAELWQEGATLEQMALALGRTRESVKHHVATDRLRFPRRNQPRVEIRNDKETVNLKLTVTPFIHNRIFAEAKRRNVSGNTVIRDILRHALLKLERPPTP